ncbi:MAG: Spy/CpxP family protein refolding chaperone [Nitrospirota bacterium]
MKRVFAVAALAVGLSVWSTAYADTAGEGDRCEYQSIGSRHKLLGQLPAEKEMLFHRTMREVREKRSEIRDEIAKAREAAREVLLTPEFNEALFKEKTAKIHDLREREHQVMEDAIAKLAKQYTPEERKLLAQVLDKSKSHRRWSSHRHMM